MKAMCKKCFTFTNIENKELGLCVLCDLKLTKKKEKKVEPTLFEFYLSIWNARPHVCELTKRELNFEIRSSLWFSCFAHLYAKSKHKQWKFLSINVLLVHPDVHHQMDHGTKDKLIQLIGEQGYKKLLNKKSKVLEYGTRNAE